MSDVSGPTHHSTFGTHPLQSTGKDKTTSGTSTNTVATHNTTPPSNSKPLIVSHFQRKDTPPLLAQPNNQVTPTFNPHISFLESMDTQVAHILEEYTSDLNPTTLSSPPKHTPPTVAPSKPTHLPSIYTPYLAPPLTVHTPRSFKP